MFPYWPSCKVLGPLGKVLLAMYYTEEMFHNQCTRIDNNLIFSVLIYFNIGYHDFFPIFLFKNLTHVHIILFFISLINFLLSQFQNCNQSSGFTIPSLSLHATSLPLSWPCTSTTITPSAMTNQVQIKQYHSFKELEVPIWSQ